MGVSVENKKVLVLKGGVSPERDISLISGGSVARALEEEGYAIEEFDVNIPDAKKVIYEIKSYNPDLVFIALHGEFGEDGQLQKELERERIKFTGSGAKASYLAMHKDLSRGIFAKQDILTPAVWENIDSVDKFPVMVKPASCGSSIGVTKVNNKGQLARAVSMASEVSPNILIEEFIEGVEISASILLDEVLPIVEIRPKESYYDFNCKYQDGMTKFIVPADISEELYKEAERISLKGYLALGCRHFGRVDMIASPGGIYMLEVNSIPGLTSHSLLPLAAEKAGINFGLLCRKIVESALKDET